MELGGLDFQQAYGDREKCMSESINIRLFPRNGFKSFTKNWHTAL